MAKTQTNKHKSRIKQRKSRRQIGSRAYKNYSLEMLKLACDAVASKNISTRDAERQFGIPRRTIINKIKEIHGRSVGHPTILTSEEEKKIVRVLQASSDFGSPLTKLDLKLLVYEYLRKNSREHLFKKKIPGDTWVQGFLARHADELSLRTTQNISKARAQKGPSEIATYFENLSITLKNVPETNIVNFDETNLSDDPGSSKGIFRRGVRYPERIANSTKGNISLMFTAIASGRCLPLYVVYKAKSLYSEWITGGPPDTKYNCTKSGWFDSVMFEDYFEKIIIPWAEETLGTKVVICDNLSSHLSVKVVELCEKHNIKFIFIPPRSTHLTQPLDVAFFAPLKKAWRKILYQYKIKNPNQTAMNKKHFPKLLINLIEAIHINEKKNIKSGFRSAGIFPLNPQVVLKKIPEIHEEIVSYGIDQALIDYLKETRSPKPIKIERNKRIFCEPGKSVTVSDLNTICCSKKDTIREKAKKIINTNNVCEEKLQQYVNENVLYLDEKTGLFTDDINISTKKYLQDNQDTEILQNEKIMSVATYSEQNNWSIVEDFQYSKIPKSLGKLCIHTVNSCLYQPVDYVTYINDFQTLGLYSYQTNTYPLISNNNDDLSNYLHQQDTHFETGKISTKDKSPKIAILSDVIIKPATKIDSDIRISTDIRLLSEVSKTENTPFMSKCSKDLPICLQENLTKKKNLKKKQQIGSKSKIKRKKKQPVYYSSSTTIDSFELDDTDNSDYETLQSYYVSEYLKEKENFDPIGTQFGLTDIEFFDEHHKQIKKDDWIIAQFATKKSLKHFVGKVLSITDNKPTIKFVRKVKQYKCNQGTIFTYPVVDDVCTIHHLQDIISVLPKPTLSRRGQIIFNIDFNTLNIQ